MPGSWIGSAVYRRGAGFVAVDPAMAQALGYTTDAMEGALGDAFMYLPDDKLRYEILRLANEGTGCRVTTCYRHGVSGEPLWITGEIVPMAPSSPSLLLVTLLQISDTGTSSVEALPDSVSPAARLRALDLDLGMVLHRQVGDLHEMLERYEAMRDAVRDALLVLLDEERPATTLEDRLHELEDRVDRLIALITSAGP